jgi:shikimate kinase
MTKITLTEYAKSLAGGDLKLSLIGMSNTGKTYWSNILAQRGFIHICCDDLIEQRLGDELVKLGYSGGIKEIAGWMGQPYDERFAANQQRYLDLEAEVLRETLAGLENGSLKGNIIVDTTGSVVHTDPAIRQKLADLTMVIYLETPPEFKQVMFDLYVAEPKPVVWQDKFQLKTGETKAEALARCYPQLLDYRLGLYAEMSQIPIPPTVIAGIKDAEGFLGYVKSALTW